MPALGYQPKLWLLGSSDYSAKVAGLLGLPFSFAHHFAAGNTLHALARLPRRLPPLRQELDRPYAMLGVAVLCAPTDEEAEWLAGSGRLAFLRCARAALASPDPRGSGGPRVHALRARDARGLDASQVVGSPDTVLAGLRGLIARTEADELMVTTMAHGFDDRMRSFELYRRDHGPAGRLTPDRRAAADPPEQWVQVFD